MAEMSPSQEGTKPNPDPTAATDAAVERAVKSERNYVEGQLDTLRERLAGIDEATKLRLAGIEGIPAQIDEKVAHLAVVTGEKFLSIGVQFKERDIRAEREARDNKVAVDAAFAAQKEAAAKQDEANAKAIDKSERATAETIKTNSELSRTTNDALRGQLEDLKERVSRIESNKEGMVESRTESRAGISSTTAIVGAVVAAIILALAMYAALRPTTTSPPAGVLANYLSIN